MAKKFELIIWDFNENQTIMLQLIPVHKKLFELDDIGAFIHRLKLDDREFDNVYSGYDIAQYVTNEHYNLSFFYVEDANQIFISITWKNDKSKKLLFNLIEEVKELNDDQMLKFD